MSRGTSGRLDSTADIDLGTLNGSRPLGSTSPVSTSRRPSALTPQLAVAAAAMSVIGSRIAGRSSKTSTTVGTTRVNSGQRGLEGASLSAIGKQIGVTHAALLHTRFERRLFHPSRCAATRLAFEAKRWRINLKLTAPGGCRGANGLRGDPAPLGGVEIATPW